jgi:outer membrane protein TolC
MFYRIRLLRFLGWALCAAAVFGIDGCSPEHYKAEADKEVYQIIDNKWQDDFGQKANYVISDVSPSPNDVQVAKAVPQSGSMSLVQAVAMATAHNRDYQRQKEQLYLAALDLTLARHRFARQWFGTIDASYAKVSSEESVGAGGELGFNQMLADGAQISTGIAIDWARFLTGDPRTSLGSILSASVTQPLLRGRGRKIAQENLTQAERDTLYQIRDFNRFRQTFVVSIVNSYYRVLQLRDAVANAENDYKRRVQSKERLEMEAQAGRKPPFEVDQAEQEVLRAQDNVVAAQERYEQQLDQFKIQLSLPTDASTELDPNELEALRRLAIIQPDYTLEAATETALARRLDLANSDDAVDDAKRKVMVAVNNLGADLDLTGSARASSPEGTDYSRLQFHQGTYSLGLSADLPLDRKAERNAYRAALIALEQRQREYQNDVDSVKLDVRDAFRQLLRQAESYRIQQNSLELAQRRVESTTLLLEAGRATTRDLLDSQSALLQAQNDLTAALVAHTVAKLDFFSVIGMLQVRPDGMWEQEEPQPKSDDSPDVSVKLAEATTEPAAKRPYDFRDFLIRPARMWEEGATQSAPEVLRDKAEPSSSDFLAESGVISE